MKNIKIAFLVALLIVSSGCKKWLDVNSDPASPQTSRAEFYLGPMIAATAISTAQDYLTVQFKYNQYIMAQGNNDTFERQGFSESDSGGNIWRLVYIHYGINLEDLLLKAEQQKAYTILGIGYALKAYGYQMLTDSHGPVILDEAFKDQLQFAYQDQPEIYARVRVWCQMALEALNKEDSGTQVGVLKTADTMFGQTIPVDNNTTVYKNRWRKFIYAILATQYSHLTNKPDFVSKYADSVVKYVDLSFGGSVLNASEDPTIGFDNTKAFVAATNGNYGDSNPFSGIAGIIGVTNGRIGQPIVNYLTGGGRTGTAVTNPTVTTATSKDPRLTRMINPMVTTSTATNGVYRGVVVADGDVPTVKTIPSVFGSVAPTFPGKYLFGIGGAQGDKPRYPLYSYAQLQFAKAEALFLKGNTGGAYTAYINGIRGHMDFVNLYGRATPTSSSAPPAITATEISDYLAGPEVAKNGGELTLADIMGQKYIAQWGWAGQEQWCDLRKHHYDPTLFKHWKPLESNKFNFTKGGVGQYVYRIRPRLNSEYLFNKAELEKWGATSPLYAYTETWFSTNAN